MKQNKISSKLYPLIRAAATAAVLPVLFIYVMIAKPDYAIMNTIGHVVVPVAQTIGDIVTWPFRLIGKTINGISEISVLQSENEELRARLDAATIDKNLCEIAIKENQKLNRELDIVNSVPYDTVIADVMHDNSVLGNNTFVINRGSNNGIESGMAVVTTDLYLVGIVMDVADNFSRIRALTDSDTNIAVRIVGSEVYGFLKGNGSKYPTIGFFSDPEFQPSAGIKLISSNISGIIPAGLLVGELVDNTDVSVFTPSQLSRVIVLKFDTQTDKYK